MSTIDPSAAALAALQASLPRVRPAAGRRGPLRPTQAEAATPITGALAQRIAALSCDAEGRRHAVRLVLEAQIAREFGDAVLTDPAFPSLIDAVQQQMEGDAHIAAATRALAQALLAPGD